MRGEIWPCPRRGVAEAASSANWRRVRRRRRKKIAADRVTLVHQAKLVRDGGQIGVALDTSNGLVRVDVTDTGPGISDESIDQIFSPFVSNDTQGTGLGLPIARELAGALGGRIELDTELGRGSRFRLVLPLRHL